MTLKNAALLALIGAILMTALLLWTFVFTCLNLLRGLVPAVMLFQSFIYAFGCFSAAVFFYVFTRRSSRENGRVHSLRTAPTCVAVNRSILRGVGCFGGVSVVSGVSQVTSSFWATLVTVYRNHCDRPLRLNRGRPQLEVGYRQLMAERVGFYAHPINTKEFSNFSRSSSWAMLFSHQQWHLQPHQFCLNW